MSGNAAAIAKIVEPHVARVTLADPKKVRERVGNGPKTDRLDARALAKLLAGGFLAAVWAPDEPTRVQAAADQPPLPAGAPAHPREEPGPRGLGPQPARASRR